MLFNLPESVGTRVIDTNSVVEALLAQRKEEQKLKDEAQEEIARTEDESGFTEGLVFASLDVEEVPAKPTVDYEAIAKEEASRIVNAAKESAANILAEAKENAEAECVAIKKDAYDEGFNQGVLAGKAQMDEMAAENQKEFDERLNALNIEYEERFNEIEKDVVEATISVFEKVFGLELSGSEEVLVYLVKNTIYEADNAKEFHIRFSREDVSDMRERLDEFKSLVSSDCTMEILSDNSLEKGQCLIETEHGVFDCGSDVQLKNLFRNLKALSN